MPITINLDVMLAKRKMKLGELSEQVGVSATNLSILKTGKAKAVRFTTLEAICEALNCQPGDILEYVPDASEEERGRAAKSSDGGANFAKRDDGTPSQKEPAEEAN